MGSNTNSAQSYSHRSANFDARMRRHFIKSAYHVDRDAIFKDIFSKILSNRIRGAVAE